MFFLFSTNFIIFLQEYFIQCMVLNSTFLLLPVKFLSVCRIVPVVLSRPTCIILKTKFSQDISLIWWMTGSIYDKCGFLYISWVVYISFPDFARALNHLIVSILRGILSSQFPAVTGTVGIYWSRFSIKGLYYTFLNIFCNFHAFKHVNCWFKSNRFTLKYLNVSLLVTTVGNNA